MCLLNFHVCPSLICHDLTSLVVSNDCREASTQVRFKGSKASASDPPAVCIFRTAVRNGIRVPLPYASSFSAAQVSRAFDTLRAIRRCGTHPVSVIDIVAIVVDVAVNDCCLVIVIARRAQPPTNGAACKPIQPCPLSIII